MFKNTEWLFFDMGSTLIDEEEAYKLRFEEIAQAANKDYAEVVARATELYAQHKKGDTEIAKILGVKHPSWFSDKERLFPYTCECLDKLYRRYRLGIIANQPLGSCARLEKLGILKYFDLVAASAEEGVSKPDKRIFEIALERSGCKAENAVMIGDRIDNDVIPAKTLGMKTIWVKQSFGQYWRIDDEAQQPDLTVDKLIDICKYLV